MLGVFIFILMHQYEKVNTIFSFIGKIFLYSANIYTAFRPACKRKNTPAAMPQGCYNQIAYASTRV
jgi:hypothetical protein